MTGMNKFESHEKAISFNYNVISHESKRKKTARINRILAIAYALKDTMGIIVAGFPIRANEFVLSLTVVISFFKGKSAKIYKNELMLIFILGFNLVHTVLVSGINSADIDSGFFIKYIVRNVLYVIVFFLFSAGKKRYSANDIKYLCRTILIINIIFMGLLYLTGYRMELGSLINTKIGSFQIMNIFGLSIPRFFGSASESGYMGPFLMMPLYYFVSEFLRKQSNKKELIIIFFMILMTFSAIVYLQAFITCVYALKNTRKDSKKVKAVMLLSMFAFLIIVVYYVSPELKLFLDSYFINKLKAFINNDKNVFDYSGTDRNMHMLNCMNLFMEQPLVKKLFGIGTGGYLYSLTGNTVFYSMAEEAYNIYLSTLLERGIIGFVAVIIMVIIISRYHVKQDEISNSIYIGIVSQYIHWMITGNMWLCYFWMEVMYLIGYYYWTKRGDLCLESR